MPAEQGTVAVVEGKAAVASGGRAAVASEGTLSVSRMAAAAA